MEISVLPYTLSGNKTTKGQTIFLSTDITIFTVNKENILLRLMLVFHHKIRVCVNIVRIHCRI